MAAPSPAGSAVAPLRSDGGRLSVALFGLSLLGLASCAQTNAFIGNHQNAAYNYRATAKNTEKSAKKEADLQNHIVAAMKYIDAARSRLSSAQEYQNIGNPVWAKNMFDKSSEDLTTAANEIKAAQSPLSN
ncbi:MAG: hypothetical protein D084_Lepto4C00391G0007 [Leptospirillum sp. Group IV 'UBA BS']|nr:MAG: hypothetical protein D084_Lepto4C00391G0007 [Leptospirillum sp. Group IV 'UBA BS']